MSICHTYDNIYNRLSSINLQKNYLLSEKIYERRRVRVIS